MIERIRSVLRGHADPDGDDARILREGFPGRGTVVAVRPTGRNRGGGGGRTEVDLTLDVFVPRLRHYRVEIRPRVTEAELGRLVPGRAVPVAVDQADAGRVVLAFGWDEPASIAGLGPFAGGPGGERPPGDPGSA